MLNYQIIRFLIGGAFVFCVSIGLLYFFVDILGIWYLWGTTLSFLISLGISFAVQKYWTFRDASTERLKGQMGVYATLQVINLAANDGLMYIGVEFAHMPYLLVQVFTAGSIAIWSYFAFRYLFKSTHFQPVATIT
ncbi:MAG: GtrA family protein [Candidatus Pacebacteria bacterium]|nr:GtrA family protein [Candidatus Paceibacterota bacterium]